MTDRPITNHEIQTSNSLHSWLLAVIPWLLALMTAGVLLFNIPDGDMLNSYFIEALIYAFLTAFTLFFSVWLSRGQFSPAHSVGMVAFLSLPAQAHPLMLWAIFMGGMAGLLTLNLRSRPLGQVFDRRIRSLVFMPARVTLSFFTASQVYIALEGPLPLDSLAWEQQAITAAALFVYSLVYITLYFAISVLEIYMETREVGSVVRTNLWLILVIMLLPVPFAITSAEISNRLSDAAAFVSLLGLVLIALGLHALSRSEYQLRKQLNELRMLSVVTRAMRSHLELEALLKTIYLQVAHLLEVENFTVVLRNPDKQTYEFPLVVRNSREESGDPARLAEQHNNALIKHVLETGAPMLVSHDVEATAQDMHIKPPDEFIYSWLGVPLLAGGQELGAIIVTSTRPERHFDQDDLRLLNIVAASASIAVENAQLYNQQRERAEQLTTLNRISSLLSGTLSPDMVLDIVISSASTLTQANSIAIYLFWDEGHELFPLVRSAGLSDQLNNNPPMPILRETDQPLHDQKPLVITDIANDERAEPLREVMLREGKSALIELPLSIGEQDMGILSLHFDQPQSFAGEQLELLRTFATQAAQAINNARTYTTTDEAFQRSVEQLLALAGIGRMLSSTVDLEQICKLVLSHALEATSSQAGVVALYDQHGRQMRALGHHGLPATPTAAANTFITAASRKALESSQPQIVDDVEHSQPGEAPSRLAESTRSQLSVPILRGGEKLGFITLESDRIAGFSAEDSHFVSQIANQAVIAIDNARLFARITEARDRLQVILDTMDEAIILINARGEIALANPRIRLIDLEPEQLLNQSIVDVLDAAGNNRLPQRMGFTRAQEIKDIVQHLNTAEAWPSYPPHLYMLSGERGTLYIQRFIIPVTDARGQTIGALLVFYNKTEEQELDHAREELSRMIVHDLRSPLTAVTTGLKLLQEIIPPESEFYAVVRNTTEASRRAVRKLLGRVDSLLDISKMQSGRLSIDPDLTELATLADSVCVELSPLAHELEITITTEIDDVPLLQVDADKVERLLLNLVDNGLKYSPSESVLVIRAYPPGENGAQKDFVRVEVIDNGPGVPDEYKEKLFDTFVQVEGRRSVRRGVGLGLAFCKLVTEAHGGRIWIEDNPTGGSIFAVTLPVARMHRLPEDNEDDQQSPPGENNDTTEEEHPVSNNNKS
jgi:K+-sensing histidine kinase KdpD